MNRQTYRQTDKTVFPPSEQDKTTIVNYLPDSKENQTFSILR